MENVLSVLRCQGNKRSMQSKDLGEVLRHNHKSGWEPNLKLQAVNLMNKKVLNRQRDRNNLDK